jgi:hypothetical protein
VQIKVSDCTRDGYVSVTCCAIMPPRDAPTTCARSWPLAVSTAAVSAAICAIE